jgi:hypothetical protein
MLESLDDQVTERLNAFAGVTVSVRVPVSPTVKCSADGEIVTTSGRAFTTTTVAVAFASESAVLSAVTVACPAPTAVTTPADVTVATPGLLEIHLTFRLGAVVGRTVAVNPAVSPTLSSTRVGSSVTLTVTGGAVTVTVALAGVPPVFGVAVIVAVPTLTAVTRPDADTVAMFILLDVHVTDLSGRLNGKTVAVTSKVRPASRVIALVESVTRPSDLRTMTMILRERPPVFVITVIVAVPADTAVIPPLEFTDTTFGLLDSQCTTLSAAFSGRTVATN